MSSKSTNTATVALHGDRALATDSSVAPPIHQSVSYYFNASQEFADHATEAMNTNFYGRHGNPTAARLAEVIAQLEGANAGMILSSGMGAITTTLLSFLSAGDHVIAQRQHYSATNSFLSGFLSRFDVDVSFVNQTSPDAFAKAIRPKTKLMILESPVNPAMTITDLSAVSEIAKAAQVVTVCDNTFATPINQRPLEWGIDLVVHSATKYIGGHHDLLAGAVVGSSNHIESIWNTSMDLGPIGAPFDAWLALRGIRTLNARMHRHNINAMKIATHLEKHALIKKVNYPGLRTHPQHSLAEKQMSGHSGILSFEFTAGYEAAHNFIEGLKLCLNAPSLGGVDSLVVHPAAMFAARLSEEDILAQGIDPGLVRISAGIEDVNDLIEDIDQALAKVRV